MGAEITERLASSTQGPGGSSPAITASGTYAPPVAQADSEAFFDVSRFDTVMFIAQIGTISGTSPTINFSLDLQLQDGTWTSLLKSGVLNTSNAQASIVVGPKAATPLLPGRVLRISWVVTGTNPVIPTSWDLYGR